jgi:altronate hydrolase
MIRTHIGQAVATTLILLSPSDDVAVAAAAITEGAELTAGTTTVVARDAIPAGHKLALRSLRDGELVHKYGQAIGVATSDIEAGEHVHVHNLAFVRAVSETGSALTSAKASMRDELPATFDGYLRPDGRVGTRNYLGVVATVNCSASAVRRIGEAVRASGILADYPGVDGVAVIAHGTGCGMQPGSEALELLRRTMVGYLNHPNMAGAIVVGLGCEDNQINRLLEDVDLSTRPVARLTIQEAGGSRAAVRAGLEIAQQMLPDLDRARRTAVPVSKLVLATQCGGSDGYSGVTANPALGAAADLVVARGGTAVLAETPEIYGADHLLEARAASPEVASKLAERIRWWESYAAAGGGSMDSNPSPGNKAGGLTTITEKSLGAVTKGGTTTLREVVGYAEQITGPGLVFMDTPGYDPVSVTGLVAGGANVVCFTTGRGSVFGCKPVPSLKLASNSATYRRMTEDMDVDCGVILDGASVEETGRQVYEEILAVASGKRTKSEEVGLGDDEFVPWQPGAVM